MSDRVSKKIYTPASLEAWFNRLTSEWEGFFSHPALESGRQLYREGEVREVELTEKEAIIHTKRDRDDLYALISWEEGKLAVRCSTEDRQFGYCLAAAGMYEIEELIADEINPLPYEPVSKDAEAERAILLEEEEKKKKEEKEDPGRSLFLRFRLTEQGLVFEPYWKDDEGNLQTATEFEQNDTLKYAEREKIIRLASFTRKSSFQYRQGQRNYIQREPPAIVAFCRNELPKWKKYFEIEEDQRIENVLNGIRQVEVSVKADAAGRGLKFSWNLSANGSNLNEGEIRRVIRKSPEVVILPEVGIFRINPEQRDLVAEWQHFFHENGTAELPRYMCFSLFEQDKVPVLLSEELSEWKDQLLSLPEEFALPDFLRPYQARGVRLISHIAKNGGHVLLADEMGLGKTVQVAALLAARKDPTLPTCIVCPASVVPVWENEIKKFFPQLEVETLQKGNPFGAGMKPAIWIASYTQLRRHKHLLNDIRFQFAILDEAQLIKNPDAKVTQACMSMQAEHRLVLTGTPLENKLTDMWTLFRFLMPGLLGSRRVFEKRLNEDHDTFSSRLRKQISPFVLRRTKKDVLKELPPKIEANLVCPLTDVQRREYEKLTKQGVSELGESIDAAMKAGGLNLFTLLTRLRQVCCDPDLLPWVKADLAASGKITFLLDKLSEALDSGHKVVIFSQFVRLLERAEKGIRERFPDTPIFTLTGSTKDRETPIRTFQRKKGAAVFLVSLKAGGTGITLHAADYLFIMDPWWNPAVEEQAVDRVHRIGQRRSVCVYRLVTEGTIEQRIADLKASKKDMFDRLVGDMDDLSDFTNYFKSLSDLVELRTNETIASAAEK